jgi:type 1 glutamine amidotransferase
LQQYDVIVFDNTNNDVFDSQAERDGLVRFVRSGKGIVGVHIACGTERNWDWFKQMMGGTFDYHPQFQEFPVLVVDSTHPSMSGIPSPWVVKDELYIMKEMNPTIRVLMVSDFSSPTFKPSSSPMPDIFGKVFPCVWYNTYDGGRQWFSALGHDKNDYQNPLFIRHILQGLEWAVGN